MRKVLAGLALIAMLAGCSAATDAITKGPTQQICDSLAKARKDLANAGEAAKSNVKDAEKQLEDVQSELKASNEQESNPALTDSLNSQIEQALGQVKDSASPQKIQESIDKANSQMDALAAAAGCN